MALLASPLAGEAQRAAAPPRIGYLTPSSQSRGIASVNYFRDALPEHGYIDGTNVVIEPRFADGYERVPAFLTELLNLKVDVLVVTGTTVAVAAQHATSTVPIVFAPAADPVGAGLVQICRDRAEISPDTLTSLLSSPRRVWGCCRNWYRICLASVC
jgi:ABC transporter substrate binding protein